ncbi:MAG: serine/threonine-protein kinase [Pseudomonadota bacterium]
MTTDRPKDRETPKAFRDDDKTLPSPVIRGATGESLGPGRVLDGRYTLVERIGAGGWGEVWRTVQNSTRREVALKILRRDLADGTEAQERFKLEAEAVSRLVHQNTVTLFDFGRTLEGETYMAMELLDGETLDQVLKREGPMASARALRVIRQVALSLDEAHGKGIVHRDVKPHNIMLLQRPGEPDFVKVLDFGVAKWVLEDHQLTTTGTTFGTPEYMSPEQVQSMPLDHRSDLYSLGLILFTLLAARPPFRGESPITVALQHINKRLPPLPADREVPRDVERLVRTLTAKDPARRPFSAAEVAELCDGLLRAMEPGAAPSPRSVGPWLALVVGVLLGTAVFALWWPWEVATRVTDAGDVSAGRTVGGPTGPTLRGVDAPPTGDVGAEAPPTGDVGAEAPHSEIPRRRVGGGPRCSSRRPTARSPKLEALPRDHHRHQHRPRRDGDPPRRHPLPLPLPPGAARGCAAQGHRPRPGSRAAAADLEVPRGPPGGPGAAHRRPPLRAGRHQGRRGPVFDGRAEIGAPWGLEPSSPPWSCPSSPAPPRPRTTARQRMRSTPGPAVPTTVATSRPRWTSSSRPGGR